MGLSDYNRKRDFEKTSEPPGRPGGTPSGRSFVIRKHAASRLHYDFRLEHDGVLKSWSVPKGPSFDPVQKRLAVETEDHPVEYGGFEGIIPRGEYGGGTVSLWDRGTWSPVGDADKGLAEGHLKFDLDGVKLRGRWALVKLKPRRTGRASSSDARSWLLVKDRDPYARPESDFNVTEALPDSVDSGRTIEEIAGDQDRVWHSNRGAADASAGASANAAATTRPRAGEVTADARRAPGHLERLPPPDRVTPLAARRAAVVPKGDTWVHEVELLGARVTVWIEDGRATLRDAGHDDHAGHGGADRTADLPELARAVLALPVRSAVVDGVATTLGADGRSKAGPRPDVLYLVDLLFLDGADLRAEPLLERKRRLAALLAGASTPARAAAGPRRLRLADHVEGNGPAFFAEACRLGAPGVVSKRAASPYAPGRKASPAWRVIACPGAQAHAKADPDAKPGGDAKADAPRRTGASTPGTPGPRTSARQSPAERAVPGEPHVNPGELLVAGVRLTHPERVLYPEVGLTKRALADYYQRIAPRMLPHVEDRPLTLVRAPQGLGGQRFYVRHPGDWAPPELRQAKVPPGTGSGLTMVADDLAGLVAFAQMNVLEVHAWNGRLSTIEQPDRVVFDLDPGPEVAWPDIVAGAKHVRAALELVGLEGFVKTTGSKGLHVVVPLEPAAGWKETMDFSHALASALVRADPTRYTTALAKAGRERKIFIDYLRNRRGATSVSVYSTRARPGAPVSAPVAWEDLDGLAGPDLDRVPAAAQSLVTGPDPWRDYFRVKQRLTSAIQKRLVGA